MQNQIDVTSATQMIEIARKAKEIRVWMHFGERHVKVVKGSFMSQMRAIRMDEGAHFPDVWCAMDEDGTFWVG